jgi:hypothetical protein
MGKALLYNYRPTRQVNKEQFIWKTTFILIIILFVQKNLKTPKTNGVPIHKQNYQQ